METVISKDGTTVAYNKTGSGPVVILVDGAMCNTTFGPMPKLVPLLEKTFTVVWYDRRGRGKSTDHLPYAPQREVEDLEALIKVVGEPVCLFGMSSGAILAVMAAEKLPVERLALFEPPFETAEENNSGDAAQHHDNLKRLIANHDESGAVKYFLNKTVGVPYLVVAIMRLLPVWNKMKGNAPSLPYDLEITKAFPLKKLMSQPTLPTLIIYGSKTADRLKHAAHSASELIRHSRLARLEGQNHNVSMTVLAPVLIDFFSNTTAST